MKKFIFLACVVWGCAQNETGAVKQRLESYVSAFNHKDAKQMAELWAPGAQYTNPLTGTTAQGRDEIAKQISSVLEEMGDSQVKIDIDAVDFPDKNLAVERGKATLSKAGEPSKETVFQVTLVKENGQWNIQKIDEVESMEAPSHFEELKELAWLVGDWSDKSDTFDVESSYQWDKYKNFLTHHFKVSVLGKPEIEGKQIIGWDPIHEEIRSWMFDSDGGFGQSTWKKEGSSWVIEAENSLPDGRLGSQVTTITPIDHDEFTLEITDREIDGEILPNIQPVKIIRKGA